MEITVEKVKLEEREGSHMKGRALVKIDDALLIHNIRIIEGKKGLFIAMPSTSREIVNEAGETEVVHSDIVHPVNQETRDQLEKAVLDKYQETLRETE